MNTKRFSVGIILLLLLLVTLLGVSSNVQAATVCTPTNTVSGTYAQDGVGDLCFQTYDLCSYINSWNLSALEVNGNPYTNVYVASSSIAPLNGAYIIHYVSTVAWGHFEIGGTCSGGGPTNTPTRTSTPVTPTVTRTPPSGNLPDLTVLSITYANSVPSCANNPKFNVVVQNIGTADAGTFVVSLNSGAQTQTVSGLAAGQSVTLSFNISAGTTTATADWTNVIAELDETNNSLSAILPIPTQAYTCTPTPIVPTITPTPTACSTDLTITGRVYSSATGLGISGATVVADTSSSHPFATTTAADGTYSLNVPSASNYACNIIGMWASATGYDTFNRALTSASLFLNHTGIDFPLSGGPTPTRTPTTPPGGSSPTPTPTRTRTLTPTTTACPAITGYVRVGSSTGPGLAGVLVTGTDSIGSITGTTDSSGFYVLGGCGRFNMVVTPQLSGYVFSPPQQTYSGSSLAVFVATTGTPTPTPVVALPCSPVTGTFNGPFAYDGAGAFCWQVTGLNTAINAWNLSSLKINGIPFTPGYIPVSSFPPQINGYWYLDVIAPYAWSHVEGY